VNIIAVGHVNRYVEKGPMLIAEMDAYIILPGIYD
jgi:hypothetical protein